MYAEQMKNLQTPVGDSVFSESEIKAIKAVWSDSGVKKAYLRANQLNLQDTADL